MASTIALCGRSIEMLASGVACLTRPQFSPSGVSAGQ
jgi:hypothetical protein